MDTRKNTGLYVIIALLFIAVIALGGYIIYDKTSNDNTSNKPNVTDNESPKDNSNVSKLDNNKDWVYDATYEKNVNAVLYMTDLGITAYAKDIVVPYINIKSDYANTANTEIKEVFDKAINDFNAGVENNKSFIKECDYQKYEDDNILSVILTYDFIHIAPGAHYYAYNFDKKTGNKLSFEDIYKIAGFNADNITAKAEAAISSNIDSIMKYFEKMDGYENTDINSIKSMSINNYKNSLNDGTLKYFLSSDGKLNIVVNLALPAGTGEFDTIITVD